MHFVFLEEQNSPWNKSCSFCVVLSPANISRTVENFGENIAFMKISDVQKTCQCMYNIFGEFPNLEVSWKSEEKQGGDDYIPATLHARLKAVSSDAPFEDGCIGVVARGAGL